MLKLDYINIVKFLVNMFGVLIQYLVNIWYFLYKIIAKKCSKCQYSLRDNQIDLKIYKNKERVISELSSHNNSLLNLTDINILRSLSKENKHLVEFKDSFYDINGNFFTLSDVEGESLYNLIGGKSERKFCSDLIEPYLFQLIDAVEFLHSRNICHSFINTREIYISNGIKLSLGGLFFCEELNNNSYKNNTTYLHYACPETHKINFKYDVWSIGCVFYEMMFKNHDRNIVCHCVNLDIRIDLPQKFKEYNSLFKNLTERNPSTRPNLTELVNESKNIGNILSKAKVILDSLESKTLVNHEVRKYFIKDFLGLSHFGYYYLTNHDNKKKVLKEFRESFEPNIRSIIEYRIDIFNRLINQNHPNMIQIFEYFQHRNSFIVISEYCEDGNLESFLNENSNDQLSIENQLDWSRQLLNGLRFIHLTLDLILKNISAKKILLTNHNTVVKYFDFSNSEPNNGITCTRAREQYYIAPETVTSKACNVWSIGCIITEICTRKAAFNFTDSTSIYDNPTRLQDNHLLKNLVEKMLERRPNLRIDSAAAFEETSRIYQTFTRTDSNQNNNNDNVSNKIEKIAQEIDDNQRIYH